MKKKPDEWTLLWDDICETWRETITVDKDPNKTRKDPNVTKAMMRKYGELGNKLALLTYPEIVETPGDDTVDMHLRNGRTIEVKIDGRGAATGNLFYEVLSNGNLSAMIRDNPDYLIFYMPCLINDETGDVIQQVRLGILIDNQKLRAEIEDCLGASLPDIASKARRGELKQWTWYGDNAFAYVYSRHGTSGFVIPWRTVKPKREYPIVKRSYFIEMITGPGRKFPV